jgi:hypothetical protein
MYYFINKLSLSSKIGICMMSSACSLGTVLHDSKRLSYNCEIMNIKDFKKDINDKNTEKEYPELIYWLSLQ